MQSFRNDGLAIAYIDVAPVPSAAARPTPILLIHGFASTHRVNWVAPGWVKTLSEAGYRVVALDNRGHGESDKPHEPEAYASRRMAGDALALLDHLGIEEAFVMGYSMGARIASHVALDRPERVKALLLGGLGIHLVEGVGLPLGIADAMEAPSLDVLTDPMQRMFRAFADANGSDLKALAACIRGSRDTLTRDEVGRLAMPCLVSVGTKDAVAGSGQALADLMPNARHVPIEGREHNLAVGDRTHKAAVLAFLAEQG